MNIITIAWTGTICTNPPMAYISVKPERFSYSMLEETGEFVINLTTRDLAFATDFCGVKSGKEVDKFQELYLTKGEAVKVRVPVIKESPVNIECKVVEQRGLGSHTMFLAEVAAVQADEIYLDKNGKFDLSLAEPIVYSHGEYFCLGERLGKFGYSVRKQKELGERKTGFEEQSDRKENRKERSGKEERLRMQLFPKEESAYREKRINRRENQIRQI